MGRLWDLCAFCGKRIETGEKCYGLPNGESVCTDCCVAENEGAAVSDGTVTVFSSATSAIWRLRQMIFAATAIDERRQGHENVKMYFVVPA